MPGKPYTMKEMKKIVEYLVEHKVYSEIRGRKMWMDLAKSQILNRTWQSLKETFIKRILPDIQNPYYKLSVEQIASFRQQSDVEARYNRNKLEVHSISDSSSTDNQGGKKKAEVKKEVENTGAASYNRIKNNKSHSKRFSRRSRVTSRNFVSTIESGSSDEYTTASDNDDPPLARGRSGHSYRYMKPQSYDFLSNADGGLFVVGRKKIYPLLLRENGAVHFACAGESHEDEEQESYWKTKFLEERKKCAEEKIRADELSRLLQQSKTRQSQAEPREAPSSPILQANQSLSKVTEKSNPKQKKEAVVSEREMKSEETVKIKFTKNHEIELEGQWSHVNPLLERMVEIFKNNETSEQTPKKTDSQPTIQEITEKQAETVTDKTNTQTQIQEDTSKTEVKEVKQKVDVSQKKKANVRKKRGSKSVEESDKNPDEVTVSSGKSTPVITAAVDPEVHEKVTKIESEIFKKIEEIEQTDQSVAKEAPSDVNVTKRTRSRPRKSQSPQPGTSFESEPKKPKVDLRPTTRRPRIKAHATDVESDASVAKYGSDSGLIGQGRAKYTKSKNTISKSDTCIPEDDPNVRYMLPPASRTKKIVSKANNIRSYLRKSRLFRPSDTSIHSESTQGYQDSDASPQKSVCRRKRRVSIGYLSKKGQIRKVKRRSSPYLADDDSNEANELHIRSGSMPNLSLNSEIYRSESYQLLLPKAKMFSQLDKIDESPIQNEGIVNQHNFTNLSPLTININNEFYIPSEELRNDSMRQRSSENSSNVSFPLSPVLSIAGNMSVSKEMISSSLEDPPSLNEIHQNDVQPVTNLNKYLMSDVDVSVPLMEQDCQLQSRQKSKSGSRTRKSTISEPIDPVNFKEQSSSESLDQKLRDLLLESAKKMTKSQTDNPISAENLMEVDPTSEKKTRPKKRCSTPRKKQTALKKQSPNVAPVLEEHTESCSFGGRKSCPPIINILLCEDANPLTEEANANKTNITEKIKEKKKKDVIKVKILRPRDKSGNRKGNNSRLSVCTDSGINDTASVLSDECRCCNESTELIHNHSDTCLHMDECVGDSVEFIETMEKSVISLNSNSIPSEVCFDNLNPSSEDYVTPELFSTDARDATSLSAVTRTNTQSTDADGVTVYHTPSSGGSMNSLVTEDLSNEILPSTGTNWYLFSEDDTNADNVSQDLNTGGMGSNLKQIFPLTCAIPDLSTITEMSRENDSMKPNLNTDNEMDGLSHSMFDSNI
ncbi:uncharacterized protein LOC126374287 isoform X2 [Pectinophora gossypiella]|uniref:uncharacterized protein LOC126374287 isoform X2 n=1 Tax=Pectinophora gossypiella TaxID=13191 RepID=UPI00214E1145|nr:uncharacterized protein LOC126374287 isoform X2 [Pectinophora gossypiella]